MFEVGFTPSENCDEPEGRHVYPDICKCEYNRKEGRRKLINELAKEIGSDHGYGGECENLCVFCDDLVNQIERLSK